MHLSFAGPGAVSVSWVTWPQDDPDFEADTSEPEAQGWLSSTRKLRLSPLTRRHHHRHHRRRPAPWGPSHCDRLRAFGSDSVVQWGTSPGVYTRSAHGTFACYSTDAFDSGALHIAVLGDAGGPLPPAAAVYYRVGDPGRRVWSPERSFVAPPPVGPASLPYRLGLLGDLGQTEHSVSTLAHLDAHRPDSVMLVGDLSYADGYQPRWDTWGRLVAAHAASTVWMVTEGNHEIEPTPGAPDFLAFTSRFPLPAAPSGSPSPLFYSYDVAGAHVVMLGSYAAFGAGSEQAAWLARDLAAVDRARTPWVVAGLHAPWYNSNYNHYGEGEGMRAALEAALARHGVDLVVAGHVHAYERSVATYRGRPDPCGPVYVNVGDGGNREGLDYEYHAPPPAWSAAREASYGHGVLDLVNATHARLGWHRNQDGAAVTADEAWLVRERGACAGRRL